MEFLNPWGCLKVNEEHVVLNIGQPLYISRRWQKKGRQQQHDRYMLCSSCNCKYINDHDHIKTDLGYNRLEERYKSCVKCRARRRAYNDTHPEVIQRIRQTYNLNNRLKINAYNYAKIECKSCGHKVCRNAMRQHERGNGCMNNSSRASSDSVWFVTMEGLPWTTLIFLIKG